MRASASTARTPNDSIPRNIGGIGCVEHEGAGDVLVDPGHLGVAEHSGYPAPARNRCAGPSTGATPMMGDRHHVLTPGGDGVTHAGNREDRPIEDDR